jgi:uncharacterized protein (DUF302 family)
MKIFLTAAAQLLISWALSAQDHWITAISNYSHAQTVTALQKNIEQKGFRIFNTIDHAREAIAVGLTLRPTTLIVFGNPKGGTPVMTCDQRMGMVLPLKILIWEDESKQVKVGFIDPEMYVEEYHLAKCKDVLAKMKSVQEELIKPIAKH